MENEKTPIRKIGICGGTFNPIHYGHLHIADTARRFLGLDCVLMMPSGYSYMKSGEDMPSAADRLRMTELAVAGRPGLIASDIEVRREGHSYTCETLAGLKAEYPGAGLYLIVGADTLQAMVTWKEPQSIFDAAVIAVYGRESGDGKDMLTDKVNANSPAGRPGWLTDIVNNCRADIRILPGGTVDISSQMIRRRMRDGLDISGLLPAAVAEYYEIQVRRQADLARAPCEAWGAKLT